MHHCPVSQFNVVRRLPRLAISHAPPALPAQRGPGVEFLILQERAALIAEALEDGQFDEAAALMRCRR